MTISRQQIALLGEGTEQRAIVDPYGGLRVAPMYRLIGITVYGSNVPGQYTQTLVGSGAVAALNGVLSLSTGATANSSAAVVSRNARFLTGTNSAWHSGVREANAGVANNTRRWGMFNATDGLFFERVGTTLGVVSRNNGVDTRVTNLNGHSKPVSDSNFHLYEIFFNGGWAYFLQDQVLIHKVTATVDQLCADMSLPIGASCFNTNGSTTPNSLYVRGSEVSRFGATQGETRFANTNSVTGAEIVTLKASPGRLHRIVVGIKGTGNALISLYDGLSIIGTTKIMTIDTGSATALGGDFELFLDFNVGLTYVTTANVGDVTIVFD